MAQSSRYFARCIFGFSTGFLASLRLWALFDRVVGVANDLGLLAEEYDPGEKRQTGNFPQALTHIALINTAHNLSEANKPVDKPVMQRAK